MRLKEIKDFKLLEYLYNNDDEIRNFFNLLDVNSGRGLDLLFKQSYNRRIFNDFMLDNFIIDNSLDYENISYLFNVKYGNNIKNLIKTLNDIVDKSLCYDTKITTYENKKNSKNVINTNVKDDNIHIDSTQGFNSDDFVDSDKTIDDNKRTSNVNDDLDSLLKHDEKVIKNFDTLHKYKKVLSFYRDEYVINIFFKYVTNFLFNNNY